MSSSSLKTMRLCEKEWAGGARRYTLPFWKQSWEPSVPCPWPNSTAALLPTQGPEFCQELSLLGMHLVLKTVGCGNPFSSEEHGWGAVRVPLASAYESCPRPLIHRGVRLAFHLSLLLRTGLLLLSKHQGCF